MQAYTDNVNSEYEKEGELQDTLKKNKSEQKHALFNT